MNKPKISVIMSTYNTKEEFLRESINSILNQTYENFEFIIICDGSKNDLEIIDDYEDKRIKVIEHEENKGLPYSLNEAIKLSEGEYIARMDSDDIAVNTRFEKQVNFLDKNKDIDICSMFVEKIGKVKGKDVLPYVKNDFLKVELLFRNVIVHPLVMIRKKFLIDNNLFYNEHFVNSQDYDLWSRCIEKGKFEIIPAIGLYYRIHDNQISTHKKQTQLNFYKEILTNNLRIFSNIDKEKAIQVIMLLFMSEQKIDIKELIEISNFMDENILHNNNCDTKYLKKVINLKIFNKALNSKLIFKNLYTILKNKKLRKQILDISNITLNIKKIYYKMVCR